MGRPTKIPPEPPKAAEALQVYMELGPRRSLLQAAGKVRVSRGSVERWSARYGWVERAAEFDARIREERTKGAIVEARRSGRRAEAERAELSGRLREMAEKLYRRASEMLRHPVVRVVTERYDDGREKTTISPARWTFEGVARMATAVAELSDAAMAIDEAEKAFGPVDASELVQALAEVVEVNEPSEAVRVAILAGFRAIAERRGILPTEAGTSGDGDGP